MVVGDGKVFFASLGCSKNLVDSEVMLGILDKHGYQVVQDPAEATVIIVNTCSFVEDAKTESIDCILEMIDYKTEGKCQKLVVTGCLSQRYARQLEGEFPEVDLFIGTGEYQKIEEILTSRYTKVFVDESKYIHTDEDPRINTSPFYTSWLKVAEGCDRRCSFCIIPEIRGDYRQRSIDSLIAEAKRLVEGGVRELNVIAQDLSAYDNLPELLNKLETIDGLDWIRLLYYYPDEIDEEFANTMSSSSKICHYLDMPIQHFSDPVLKRMNRKITGEQIQERIKLLRSKIPGIVLRTSILVGFPGETEYDFETLLEGVKQARFDHLGVFRYSDEENTPSFKMRPKIDAKEIEKRYEIIYEAQQQISLEKNREYLGRELDVIIEGTHEETELLLVGRHKGQAPEIDGKVIINDLNGQSVNIGDLVKVKISDVNEYDLVGAIV